MLNKGSINMGSFDFTPSQHVLIERHGLTELLASDSLWTVEEFTLDDSSKVTIYIMKVPRGYEVNIPDDNAECTHCKTFKTYSEACDELAKLSKAYSLIMLGKMIHAYKT